MTALLALTALLATAAPAAAADRSLILEAVELEGGGRTSLETVLAHLPLQPGQVIDQAMLVAAVEELRQSGLFAETAMHTRPGASRGRLVLVLEVREHGLDFRWAAGNTDLDGWYLVPAMVAADNVSGRGDRLDLQLRLGFRHSGILLGYTRPDVGDRNGRGYWGARLGSITTDRPWFTDGIEYRQEVQTGGLAVFRGWSWSRQWLGEIGLEAAGVRVSRTARAHGDAVDGSISYDDEISGDALPRSISDGLGDDGRAILHLDLQHDTRPSARRAGSPAAGVWGRLKMQGVLQGERSHLGLFADLRSYHRAPGGVLAWRLRGSAVTANAPFYDRLYLGGMYTVRGFPTHALSSPGGDTWLWSGTLEYRSRILGRPGRTNLAGVLFLDVGASGNADDDAWRGTSVGVGYGVRQRIWWLDWIGVDVGFPLTSRPVDQRFQVSASIGWSF